MVTITNANISTLARLCSYSDIILRQLPACEHITPLLLLPTYPQYLTSRASGLVSWCFMHVRPTCLWSCDHRIRTGCIGSNLNCPSACGICLHICLTVDGKGTDPRRACPLNALALMSIILQHDSDAAFHTTARTERLRKLLLKAPDNNQFLYFKKLPGRFGVF